MRFGTYHTFQCPPWLEEKQVFHDEMARLELAEALGYDDVWVPEQHFTPYCMSNDPLLLAAHAAARTKRVRIGTAVVNLCYVHPLRLAESATLVDILSGGRIDLGVGRGYQIPQYYTFNVPMAETREIADEAVEILLRAWSGERFAYQGRYFRFPETQLHPTPLSSPRASILVASNSEESMRKAVARRLPAIMARPIQPFDEAVTEFARYRTLLEEAGYSVNEIADTLGQAPVLKYVYVAPTKREAVEEMRSPFDWHMKILDTLTRLDRKEIPKGYEYYARPDEGRILPDMVYDEWVENVLVFGDPESCARQIARLDDAGVRRLILWMAPGGLEHEKVVRSMELFAKEVMPRFR
jgi:alkanesulfonate monooxygenase SsuD/methylene tetrahydromethanopterin reductase-like flavin-dependent oxidoreductase (luciferase family)